MLLLSLHCSLPQSRQQPNAFTRCASYAKSLSMQPRAWDWMFQTLYSAARPKRFIDRSASSGHSAHGGGEGGDDDEGNFAREAAATGTGGWAGPALQPGVGLRLHLPETVLFSHGKPTKWLGTSEWDGGIVQRRSLANTYTARAQTIKRQTGGAKPGKTFEASV